ncbi:MAG: hypothetical protein KC609_13080 [Myxococcales bacterium]|nr:hypothetical protein [Myxococcales bacterium]
MNRTLLFGLLVTAAALCSGRARACDLAAPPIGFARSCTFAELPDLPASLWRELSSVAFDGVNVVLSSQTTLFVLRRGTATRIEAPEPIRVVYGSRATRPLWVGTSKGLFRLAGSKLTLVALIDGGVTDLVWSTGIDALFPKGTTPAKQGLIVSSPSGILLLEGDPNGSIRSAPKKVRSEPSIALTLAPRRTDRPATLVAMTRHGLLLFRAGRVERLARRDGAPHGTRIVFDGRGRLWVATRLGFVRSERDVTAGDFGPFVKIDEQLPPIGLARLGGNVLFGNSREIQLSFDARFFVEWSATLGRPDGPLRGLFPTATGAIVVGRRSFAFIPAERAPALAKALYLSVALEKPGRFGLMLLPLFGLLGAWYLGMQLRSLPAALLWIVASLVLGIGGKVWMITLFREQSALFVGVNGVVFAIAALAPCAFVLRKLALSEKTHAMAIALFAGAPLLLLVGGAFELGATLLIAGVGPIGLGVLAFHLIMFGALLVSGIRAHRIWRQRSTTPD